MKQAILHLGFSKCGSTSIQESLAKYDDGRTFYARLGRPNHNMIFHAVFGNPPYALSGFKRLSLNPNELQNYRRESLEKLKRELSRPNRERVIFSGENIASLKKNELTTLQEFLADYVDSIHVISYARHPLEYCPSAFQQRVKGGLDHIPDIISPRYIQQITKLNHAFPDSKVSILSYERKKLREQCIVRDFCAQIGISVTNVTNTNTSLSAHAVKCLYLHNQNMKAKAASGPTNYKLRDDFIGFLSELFSERMSLDLGLFAELYSRDDLSYLMDSVGISYDTSPAERKTTDAGMTLNDWLEADHEEINSRIHRWLCDHGFSLSSTKNKEAVNQLFTCWSQRHS